MGAVRRRTFLKAGLVSAGVSAFGPSFWRAVYSAPALPGPGPYGALLPADANGVMLPPGFTSRILANGLQQVADTSYIWHASPDGGAVIPADDGGWYYVSNSELTPVPPEIFGGVGTLRFDASGEIADAYRILNGTTLNCAGGRTPWGTWLSCEEYPAGRVWECDPTGSGQGIPRPMLGTFSHEAVAVDPDDQKLYLTEDQTQEEGDGFYRFTPDSYPDLTAGVLEAAVRAEDGSVTWVEINPLLPVVGTDRNGATAFDGAEGVWYDSGHVYFTTKEDNKVWDLDVAAQRIDVLYDGNALGDSAPLSGVDNITMSEAGDLYVCEDGGNLEIVMITREREVAPFLRLPNQVSGAPQEGGTELAGVAFDPSGTRLYFSSQRAIPEGFSVPEGLPGPGITYEITGPFRTAAAQTTPTTTTTTMAALPSTGDEDAGAGGSLPATGIGATLGAVGAAAAAAAALARAATRAAEGSERS